MAPLVSIVVPFFDRHEFIPQLAETVLDQTLTDWELIVVDDCSARDPTDAFLALLPQSRTRIIRLAENCGPANARNVGVNEAAGRFIAFLDSDDLWKPEKLEKQVRAALGSADPERVVCTTRTLLIRDHGQTIIRPIHALRETETISDHIFLNRGYISTPSIVISAGVAKTIGFDNELISYEDYDFLLRAEASGCHGIMLEEPLTIVRDDERPGRLSRDEKAKVGGADLFLRKNRDRLSRKAQLSFLTRWDTPTRLARTPLKTSMNLVSAVGSGVVTPRYMAWCYYTCLRLAFGS